MPTIDREGFYQADVMGRRVKTFPSGSIAISLRFAVSAYWNGEEWEGVGDENWEVWGDFFVIKKDGTPNEKTVRDLVEILGWNRDLESVEEDGWNPPMCSIQVKRETFNGRPMFKAAWLHPKDQKPGDGVKSTDPALVKQLQSKYGSRLKQVAVQGGQKQATPAPNLPKPDSDLPF